MLHIERYRAFALFSYWDLILSLQLSLVEFQVKLYNPTVHPDRLLFLSKTVSRSLCNVRCAASSTPLHVAAERLHCMPCIASACFSSRSRLVRGRPMSTVSMNHTTIKVVTTSHGSDISSYLNYRPQSPCERGRRFRESEGAAGMIKQDDRLGKNRALRKLAQYVP